ncbi:sterol desaturase family protein [Candidatus Haliotispira prima]|uniref:Sterol desaturase family protein n=1 Tax=Candidatus Haliotispira prima TaxID=3034016 RepID=A0ABY8MGL0_9SPIO|nr:sterol desaturase family protein [Candidatus Haliotispira prima]
MEAAQKTGGTGYRDEKGYWYPTGGAGISPFFYRKSKLRDLFTYIFGWGGYLWPWHLFYGALALLAWHYLVPQDILEQPFSLRSFAYVYGKNLILMWIIYGFLHYLLYIKKAAGAEDKFNARWPETGKRKFLFSDQVKDNIFWSCVSGGIVWSTYETGYYWLWNQGFIPRLSFEQHPVWFLSLFLILPFYRDTHFYWIHRLLHWRPLLRSVHQIHHHNPNPGPWSGMSMHPVEHLLYFSSVLLFLVVPSHPVHFFFILLANALAPAVGHIGFNTPLFRGTLVGGDYFHFLHHRFVACNYGTPTAPWDKVFGSFFAGDGEESYQEWKQKRKTQKANNVKTK